MESSKKIYVGLDMGTSSVGWAVTDENYQLLRAKGKDLWGVRLFEEAQTGAKRRTYRVSRRRREREKARLGLLREYFSDAINEVDPCFFQRLDESAYWADDRSEGNRQKFSVFHDSDFTDREYYKKYPTIFHLRKALLKLQPGETMDVRLVYLALANMFRHRGHFLNASLEAESSNKAMSEAYQAFAEQAELFGLPFSAGENVAESLEKCLGEKGMSRSKISEKTAELLGITKKQKAQYELVLLMSGRTGKLINIYGGDVIGEDHKTASLCFRDLNYEEKEQEARNLLGDDYFELIEAVKAIHDIGMLANVMKGHTYLTEARVEEYDKHKWDLWLLKAVLKKYDKQAYNQMFRVMEAGNYSAYVGGVNSDKAKMQNTKQRRNGGKGRSQEELYKTIKKTLKSCPADDKDVQKILLEISDEQFLPKQLTAANGIIPNQVYVREMKTILQNAERFLPFLSVKNSYGRTVSEQILEIFRFRIPYYVGPLGQQYADRKGYNVWSVRRDNEKVLPWNFAEKIDLKETAEKFILRMTRHCTYLRQEQTLPRESLLYEKYMVLNELNKLKINGEPISVDLKQRIYEELFMRGKRVALKHVKDFLYREGILPKTTEVEFSGVDQEGVRSSLKSYGRFCAALGKKTLSDEEWAMAEKIIFWGTVYGQDKKLVKERVTDAYGDKLSQAALKRILGYKFDGWGKLSREFLEMPGKNERDRSIIDSLWNTNENLMELLSDGHTYKASLEERITTAEKPLQEWQAEDLDDMYLSAPVKRMVWQTLKIMRELSEILPAAPDRIFVEMARNEGEKGVRKSSRKKKLLDLYRNIRDEEHHWKKEMENYDEGELRSKKMYLYYLQMGRCMYSGELIDLDDLFNDNLYDIDHIYPRHFVKDDNLENNLVLVKKQINAHKSDMFPLEHGIRENMHAFWKMLRDKDFITNEKYSRLMRTTQFSEEERAAFISRQLVETMQGTKTITEILQRAFPDTRIVFSKASEVSDFRRKFELIKVRCVNDLHHAQDAYLNIVVGNAYYVKFTSSPLNFIREAERGSWTATERYHMDKIFNYDIQRGEETAWRVSFGGGEPATITTVKKIMRKHSQLITKRSYFAHDGISDDTIESAEKAAHGQGYIPVKSVGSPLADVTKYGGRTSVKNTCYCLAEYKVNGKRKLCLEALPVYLGKPESLTEGQILAYLEKMLREENKGKSVSGLCIKFKNIRIRSKLRLDRYTYYLAGKTGKQIYLDNAEPLYLSDAESLYCKKLEKAKTRDYYLEKDKNGELVIAREKNMALWNRLIYKLQSSVYTNKINSIYGIMKNGAERFESLKLEEQCLVLLNIVMWFQLGNYSADLVAVGGSKKAGVCLHSKNISEAKEAVLIQQSSTGLFSREVDLLKL